MRVDADLRGIGRDANDDENVIFVYMYGSGARVESVAKKKKKKTVLVTLFYNDLVIIIITSFFFFFIFIRVTRFL